MKIFILRHAERVHDTSFFAPLTKDGLIYSENTLNEYLSNLNINEIYSSPFLRCMQTIYPFSKNNDIKINIDYSLSEFKIEPVITPVAKNVTLPLYIAEIFNYNPYYKSLINTCDIPYPETIYNMVTRVNRFLKKIINKYSNTNENILIVTHHVPIQIILKSVMKYGDIKPDYPSLSDYPQGQVSLIYDNKFTFKKITDL